jgi:hypothetical protein
MIKTAVANRFIRRLILKRLTGELNPTAFQAQIERASRANAIAAESRFRLDKLPHTRYKPGVNFQRLRQTDKDLMYHTSDSSSPVRDMYDYAQDYVTRTVANRHKIPANAPPRSAYSGILTTARQPLPTRQEALKELIDSSNEVHHISGKTIIPHGKDVDMMRDPILPVLNEYKLKSNYILSKNTDRLPFTDTWSIIKNGPKKLSTNPIQHSTHAPQRYKDAWSADSMNEWNYFAEPEVILNPKKTKIKLTQRYVPAELRKFLPNGRSKRPISINKLQSPTKDVLYRGTPLVRGTDPVTRVILDNPSKKLSEAMWFSPSATTAAMYAHNLGGAMSKFIPVSAKELKILQKAIKTNPELYNSLVFPNSKYADQLWSDILSEFRADRRLLKKYDYKIVSDHIVNAANQSNILNMPAKY